MTFLSTDDPVAGNDNTQGFLVNGEWRNTSTQKAFTCTDNSTGAAVWPVVQSGDLLSPGTVTNDRLVVFDGTDGLQTKEGSKTATEVGTHLDSTSNPHSVTAGQATFTPNGDISATDTQAAIVEVRDDTDTKLSGKAPTSHAHAAGDVTSGTFADARVAESNVTQHEGAVDHDALTNFAIAEHRVINDAGTSTTELWSASKIEAVTSAIESGMTVKPGADTSTTGVGNIALTGEQTLNGLLTSTSRVIVTEQTVPADNGIYDTAAGAWSRSTDADEDAEVANGDLIYVTNTGSTKVNCKYLLVTTDPITVGVTGQDWEETCPLELGTTAGTATEGDDSRVPTQDENDALVGTSGTPSSANKFVTNADSRNTDARTPTAHTIASHSDTTATGTELETLTDGSNADALHVHTSPSVAHSATTGQTADDHHSEAHTIASHSDTTATGAELETLTDGSNADALHVHAAPSIAHADTTGKTANDHHTEDHASRHQNGGADEINVGGLSGLLADAQTPASHSHAASDVTSGTFADTRVAESNVTQHEAAIDHDALANFAAGEHRVINDAGTGATELWSASKISTELASTGGADLWAALDANDATFPASNPAAADSRNGHPVLAFDDTTAESVVFHEVMSRDYSAGNLTIDIDWVAATAITNGVTWGVEVERNNPGGSDIDSDSFDTQQTGNSTTNGTSGVVTRASITLTQAEADGIAAGDAFRLRVQRVVSDGDDDMVGDAQILRVIGRQ